MSEVTSSESTYASREAVSAPVHEKLRAAMQEAGFGGHVTVGFNDEMQYIWARWSSAVPGDNEKHLVMRVDHEDYTDAFIPAFVKRVQEGAAQQRLLNGLLTKERWQP